LKSPAARRAFAFTFRASTIVRAAGKFFKNFRAQASAGVQGYSSYFERKSQ
jgi:hypothetical protein